MMKIWNQKNLLYVFPTCLKYSRHEKTRDVNFSIAECEHLNGNLLQIKKMGRKKKNQSDWGKEKRNSTKDSKMMNNNKKYYFALKKISTEVHKCGSSLQYQWLFCESASISHHSWWCETFIVRNWMKNHQIIAAKKNI